MRNDKTTLAVGLLVLVLVFGAMIEFMDHGADVKGAVLAVGAGGLVAADITRRLLSGPSKQEDAADEQPSLPGAADTDNRKASLPGAVDPADRKPSGSESDERSAA